MRRVQVLVRRQVRRRCGAFAETKTMRDDAARVRRRRRCGVCGDEDEDEDDRLILADLENSDRTVARECAKAGAK